MEQQDTLIDRLKKIEALASSGVGGERENARKMLNALCRRHGVTIDQLATDKKTFVQFKFSDRYQRALLNSVIAFICKTREVCNYKKGKSIFFELTVAQQIDAQDCYAHYRKQWSSNLKEVMVAFIHKNRILIPFDQDDDEKQEPIDIDRMNRLVALVQGMDSQQWKNVKKISGVKA